MLTVADHNEYVYNLWAKCAWNARNFDYDLFIDQQMNEGIDPHDGTLFGEEVVE